MEIEYRRPIDLDQSVTVAMWTEDLGESSLDLAYEVRADGEVATTAETVQVVMDEAAAEPRPIPEEWREHIEQHHSDR